MARFLLTFVVLTVILAVGQPAAFAQRSGFAPVLRAASNQVDRTPAEPGVMRTRAATPDRALLEGIRDDLVRGQAASRTVDMSFFADVPIAVTFQSVEALGRGRTALHGKVDGDPLSSAVVVIGSSNIVANVSTGGKVYQLRDRGTAGTVVREVDPEAFPQPDVMRTPPALKQKSPVLAARAAGSTADDGSIIDVLVVYTPQARIAAGGKAAMESEIALAVAETNGAYANSSVIQRVRLVHMQEIAYQDSGDLGVDLDRLTATADGFMDDVHMLRDGWGADLVNLWVQTSFSSVCGIGWHLDTVSASYNVYGFSVVTRDCANAIYAFGHELGHNMGLRHDTFVDAGTTPYPYAHGYVDVTHRFRTIMSYSDRCSYFSVSCALVPYFSNPGVNYSGFPAGNASTADNARALDNTRITVAQFRTTTTTAGAAGTIGFAATAFSVPEGGGTVQVPVYRMAGSTGAVSVTYNTANGTATAGSDYTGVAGGTVTWADGDTDPKTISVTILQDNLKEPHETFSIALSAPSGGATLGVANAVVTILDDEPDSFPVGCTLPTSGWTNAPAGSTTGWNIATDSTGEGTCSLKSGAMADAPIGQINRAQIQFTGSFAAGNISFMRRVSSENGWDCLRFYVDGASQNIGGTCQFTGGIGASGEMPWATVSIPVSAGNHTLVWSYEKDESTIGGADAAWIDAVVLPLAGPATVSLSPATSLDLGDTLVGTTSPAQTVTVTNSGGSAATLSSIGTSGDFDQATDCGGSLGAGSSCHVNLSFSPTQSGVRSGTLTILSSAAGSPYQVNLTGFGQTPITYSATTMIVPIAAQTASYSTETYVRNASAAPITLNVLFYEGANSATPGQRPCSALNVPANSTVMMSLGSQCSLGAGAHFGMLVLEDAANPKVNAFTVYSRSQTPAGNGFSVEGWPLAQFDANPAYVEGLRRSSTGPSYLSNCFVGALGAAVDYRLDLYDASDTPIGSPLTGTLQPWHMLRYLDVLAAAGAPAGDYSNVRARFTETGSGSPAFVGFCTVQESITFGADFRLAK